MSLYAGVDLHSNNSYIGIVDEENVVRFRKKCSNDLPVILGCLEPFRDDLEAIAVESTYNWYWIVDGLMDAGYPVHLANPAAMKEYSGLKHRDDRKSALWIADLLRLKILPRGYIYPKEDRPVRDLLRKRLHLVRHQTSHIVSIKNIMSRNLGTTMRGDAIKKLDTGEVGALFPEPCINRAVTASLGTVHHLKEQIEEIEKTILEKVRLRDGFKNLLTVPGIGTVLGLTVMLEAGDIRRFPTVGDYASYCRCVESIRTSNGKKTGKGNRKNGNRYLAWAYIEAANFAKRYYPVITRYFTKKVAKTNKAVAIKTVGHKLARASYYVMRDNVPFDEERLFG